MGMTTKKGLWQKIKHRPFFIRLFNWEYWPIYIANIPVVFIWLYFAIRARSLFFFTSVNPVIETGGVLGESKINILNSIPKEQLPETLFIKKENSLSEIKDKLQKTNLSYPLIAKPDVGERGLLVKKLHTDQDLTDYVEENKVDFIIQEFIDLPMELSIVYYRMPDSNTGYITSICEKQYLHVIGDGISTVLQLIESKARAILQLKRMKVLHHDIINIIPAKGEKIELEPIGNHSRGTLFLNANHYYHVDIVNVMNEVGQQMEGIHFGRFDMKCKSIEDLKKGKDFKILEFNGIASEPAHVYDPSYPIHKVYRDFYKQWKIIYNISKVQRKKGVKPMTLKEAYQSVRTYNQYMKMLEA